MIAAQELRIGNSVNVKNFGYAQISGLSKVNNTILPIVQNEKSEINVTEGMLDAIPLSATVLEKAGFKYRPNQNPKSADGDVWGIGNTTILYGTIEGGGKGWFLDGYHNDVHLEYVHQLQNLYYSLTGKELDIKL